MTDERILCSVYESFYLKFFTFILDIVKVAQLAFLTGILRYAVIFIEKVYLS